MQKSPERGVWCRMLLNMHSLYGNNGSKERNLFPARLVVPAVQAFLKRDCVPIKNHANDYAEITLKDMLKGIEKTDGKTGKYSLLHSYQLPKKEVRAEFARSLALPGSDHAVYKAYLYGHL